MPSDPPNDPLPAPEETTAPKEPPAEVFRDAPDAPAEAVPVPAAAADVPAAPAVPAVPAAPAEPVSPVKEWAIAVALMIVFAIICAQFITFLRANQYGP